MHELPEELRHSLQSFRGSIYGGRSSGQHDLEKGQDDYGERQSAHQHPTKSRRALHQSYEQQDRQQNAQPIQRGGQQHPGSQDAVAKRQPALPPPAPAPAKRSVFTAPQVADPDPAADRLDDDLTPLSAAEFYELMGMRAPTSENEQPKELATRNGLYGRVRKHMGYIQTKYRIYDVAVYVFLVLQLFLSAIFIILGSLTRVDSHVAIAVLGAVSTVIAGLLALMKGQGLPQRLRQTRDALRNVIFEAEELYWDFAARRPVLYKDVKRSARII
ncbi:hypothetical protein H2203_005558 [Taxawa tesnikishii (nom. ined.)]|nr:hypothetical protein H2203_005558 [Dothideales sp. JES 119]